MRVITLHIAREFLQNNCHKQPDTVGEFMKTATLGRNSYGRSRVYRGSKQFANRIQPFLRRSRCRIAITSFRTFRRLKIASQKQSVICGVADEF